MTLNNTNLITMKFVRGMHKFHNDWTDMRENINKILMEFPILSKHI